MKSTIISIATVMTLSFVAFTSQAAMTKYTAHGSVVAIDPATQEVTLKVNPIAQKTIVHQEEVRVLNWPARTFIYKTTGKDVLNEITVGQPVDVKFN